MDPVRRDLSGRVEGEAPRVESWVRKLERRSPAHEAFCEQKVEIQRSRAPPLLLRTLPPGRPFELLTAREKMVWPSRPLDQNCCVEEVILRRSDRTGAPQPRCGDNPSNPCNPCQTIRKQRLRAAHVAAEPENDAKHQPG